MKRVLGLDLGVSSIGWAMVELNNTGSNKIIAMGTRIVPLSVDEKDQFEKGNAQTKNRDRTAKRSARKNNFRYKLRRETLVRELGKLNMLPGSEWYSPKEKANGTGTNLKMELWKLRAKAASEQITLQELGRVLLHLNQKRGYKSNRKSKDTESSEKDFYKAIDDRTRELNGRTIGQYFYDNLLINSKFRIKKNLFYRSTYEAEFDTIWNKQKQFYPQVLTDALYDRIKNEIIYHQRKLKSQKHLVGGCEFESRTYTNNGEKKTEPVKVAPLSSPLFQEAKVWQTINNIEIKSIADKTVLHLENEQRRTLYELVSHREKTSWEQILRALGVSKDDYRTNVRKDITGNFTRIELLKRLTAAGIPDKRIIELTAYDPLLADGHDKQPYYRLWHVLYSIDDPELALQTLQKQFSFTDKQANEIMQAQLKDGFASVSTKALRKILPGLQNGLKYHEACAAAGYRHSHHVTTEENEVRDLIPYSALKNIQRGSLRNPAVEKILNQLINLVKDIYSTYGEPTEIRIELARELKQNADQRNRTFKQNKDREKDHDKIRAELQKYDYFKGRRITRGDIEKYKLWREFDYCSPYRPNEKVRIEELFSNSYEVEHIIPRARLFDDSFANKVIAHVDDNRLKDKDTAFDFMQNKRASLFQQYQQFVQSYYKRKEGISKAKFDRLNWSKAEIPGDFINRQLRETQYITREARKILWQICRQVSITSGSVTDYLRHIWGYDNVIHDLNFPLFKSHGLTELVTVRKDHQEVKVEKIIGWNKRLDHRHHAVDALVIACTTQGMVQHLNELNQTTEQAENETKSDVNKKKGRRFPAPFSTAVVAGKVSGILTSFKAGKKVATLSYQKRGKYRDKTIKHYVPRAALHEETVYGKVKQYKNIEVKKLTPELIERIAEPAKADAIKAHLALYDNDFKKGLSATALKTLLYNNEPLQQVNIYGEEYVTRYQLGDTFKLKDCEFIIDKRVRDAVKKRLFDFNENSKEAFKELDKNPIYLDKQAGLFVTSVTCKTNLSDLWNAKRGYVKPGNNHHIAVYQTESGQLSEKVVSLWEAVERKKQGLPIVEKEHPDYGTLKLSLQENEMVVFDLGRAGIEEALKAGDTSLISRHLFRVRKITKGSFWFNHHLETEPRESTTDKAMNRCVQASKSSLFERKVVKVKVNRVGQLKITDD